jgi:hypothetical protein
MANPFTKTQDIITYFESIIDDSLDSVTELTLAEQAKNEIEDEKQWEMLKIVDTSQSFNSGDNYLTAKTLPSTFREPLDSGIFVTTNDLIPYLQLPLEDLYRVQDNIAHRYIIDIANNQYHILGKPTSGIIYFWHKKITPTLDTTTGPNGNTPVWPIRFWPLISMRMAMIFFAIDQGLKAASWDDRWDNYYTSLHEQMKSWDEKLHNIAYQNRYIRQREGSLVLYPENSRG